MQFNLDSEIETPFLLWFSERSGWDPRESSVLDPLAAAPRMLAFVSSPPDTVVPAGRWPE